ncbi:hypothetical protein CEXT_445121 [Caerostris extrusa]|uniref:Uncharacterized protein n=1 Tax=Caerostris extrusa TaxID=172846 RepID=A0AAV4XAF9_CAEEX|nr:hypothetical protein CEXT_445121 [Caerostris extrusa]
MVYGPLIFIYQSDGTCGTNDDPSKSSTSIWLTNFCTFSALSGAIEHPLFLDPPSLHIPIENVKVLTWAKKLFNRVVLFPSCCYCSVYYLSREAWEVDTLSSGCFWDLTVSGWDGFWGNGAAFYSGKVGNFGGTQSQNRVLVHDWASVNPGVFPSEVKRGSFSLCEVILIESHRGNLMRRNQIRGNVGRSDSSRSSFDVAGDSRGCSGLSGFNNAFFGSLELL